MDKVPYDRSSDQDVYRIRKGHGCRSKKWTAWKSLYFSGKYYPELLALTGDTGGKRVMRKYMQDVALLEVPDKKELTDMDIPPDIS